MGKGKRPRPTENAAPAHIDNPPRAETATDSPPKALPFAARRPHARPSPGSKLWRVGADGEPTIKRPTEEDAQGNIGRPLRAETTPDPPSKASPFVSGRPHAEQRPGAALWVGLELDSDADEAHYYKGVNTYCVKKTEPPFGEQKVRDDQGRLLPDYTLEAGKHFYATKTKRAIYHSHTADLPISKGPFETLDQKRARPEWWLHCAEDKEIQPKGWVPDDENWHAPEAQKEDPRHQCMICGRGLKGTDWLCWPCKQWIGRQYKDELAANIGVAADRLGEAPAWALTPKGKRTKRTDPQALNSGDLDYFRFKVWPAKVKERKNVEKKRRLRQTVTYFSYSYDRTLEDGHDAIEEQDGGLLDAEEGAQLAQMLFGRNEAGLRADTGTDGEPIALADEPELGTDVTSGEYTETADERTRALRRAIASLTQREQNHVNMRLRGMTQQDIATAQGYRRQATASAHWTTIKTKLRAALEADG